MQHVQQFSFVCFVDPFPSNSGLWGAALFLIQGPVRLPVRVSRHRREEGWGTVELAVGQLPLLVQPQRTSDNKDVQGGH